MYVDGFIAYSEKSNQSQIKQDIDPKEIVQLMRSKSTITIVAEKHDNIAITQGLGDKNSLQLMSAKQPSSINYSFKFATIDESKEWYKLICSFIQN